MTHATNTAPFADPKQGKATKASFFIMSVTHLFRHGATVVVMLLTSVSAAAAALLNEPAGTRCSARALPAASGAEAAALAAAAAAAASVSAAAVFCLA